MHIDNIGDEIYNNHKTNIGSQAIIRNWEVIT